MVKYIRLWLFLLGFSLSQLNFKLYFLDIFRVTFHQLHPFTFLNHLRRFNFLSIKSFLNLLQSLPFWCLNKPRAILKTFEFLFDLIYWHFIYNHAHPQHLVMFLSINMIVPRLAILKAALAFITVEGKHAFSLHVCRDDHHFAQLWFRLEVSINWCETFLLYDNFSAFRSECDNGFYLLVCSSVWNFENCSTVLVRFWLLCLSMVSFHLWN